MKNHLEKSDLTNSNEPLAFDTTKVHLVSSKAIVKFDRIKRVGIFIAIIAGLALVGVVAAILSGGIALAGLSFLGVLAALVAAPLGIAGMALIALVAVGVGMFFYGRHRQNEFGVYSAKSEVGESNKEYPTNQAVVSPPVSPYGNRKSSSVKDPHGFPSYVPGEEDDKPRLEKTKGPGK
jgi:hypothetical protein